MGAPRHFSRIFSCRVLGITELAQIGCVRYLQEKTPSLDAEIVSFTVERRLMRRFMPAKVWDMWSLIGCGSAEDPSTSCFRS